MKSSGQVIALAIWRRFKSVYQLLDFNPTCFQYWNQNERLRRQANIADSGKSEAKNDKDIFQIDLNVSQFKPEELDLKVCDKYVVIHGKHDEKSDEHGFVSREFTRRYMLPTTCETEISVLLSVLIEYSQSWRQKKRSKH
ncbi:Alpha-crystallin A chain [Araneus ventricosus]|uniref:Alpha-crystallin A chain n=1 Tax=Araneus ventricosus TaxID=182803 RepID=A0A4Y2QZJ1_ARAVE|nr:Alpha-crystallin A chain [Araneus ventricosus]